MPLRELTSQTIALLLKQTEHSRGKAILSFNIYDDEDKTEVEMFSRNTMVQVSNELVEFLEKNNIEYTLG